MGATLDLAAAAVAAEVLIAADIDVSRPAECGQPQADRVGRGRAIEDAHRRFLRSAVVWRAVVGRICGRDQSPDGGGVVGVQGGFRERRAACESEYTHPRLD